MAIMFKATQAAVPRLSRKATRVVRCDSQSVSKIPIPVTLFVGLASATLLMCPLQVDAAVVSLADQEKERQQEFNKELQILEFIQQQRANARKASLASKLQSVESQASVLENIYERKIIEEKANLVAAESTKDDELLAKAAAEVAQLEKDKENIEQVAAKVEAQIEQAEIVEEARLVASQQAIEKLSEEGPSSLSEASVTAVLQPLQSSGMLQEVPEVPELTPETETARPSASVPDTGASSSPADDITAALENWLAQFN